MIFTRPPTGFIGTLPYVWLPTFLVPLAVGLHTASLMRKGGYFSEVKVKARMM